MIVIGVSGRKQAGKSTFGNFILALYLAKFDYCNNIYIDEQTGELLVSDLLGDDRFKGVFNFNRYKLEFNDPRLNQALELFNKNVKIYNFADVLKTDICINILGLTYDQCYGTDEQKNELTTIRWSSMPAHDASHNKKMTAREIMQFIGTDIFRSIDSDIWVKATIKKILNEQPKVAIITDCRFPNEVEAIKNIGGKVFRLTRNKFNSDHESECILDKDRYDWKNFDYILDNENISVQEQFEQIKKIMETDILTEAT
jgi:hypothetical protein